MDYRDIQVGQFWNINTMAYNESSAEWQMVKILKVSEKTVDVLQYHHNLINGKIYPIPKSATVINKWRLINQITEKNMGNYYFRLK